MSIVENLERKLSKLMKQPNNPYIFNDIGVILYGIKDWKNAEMYFQRAYEIDSENKDILYNYAAILYQQGKLEKAICIYEFYLELHKDDKEVIERVGDCYYQLGNYKLAREMYEQLQNFRKENF